ncbi:hypothetical protein PENSPDRAFT_749223 [Peniophora sp. CONT]|nr:hypothetical protein PENSPDRAFT_749223 [Peniophora sp. CONT]
MSNSAGSPADVFGSGSKFLFVAFAVIPCVALGWMLERRRRRRLDAVVARFLEEEYPELRPVENHRIPSYFELAVADTEAWLTSWKWTDAQPLAAAQIVSVDAAKRSSTRHKTQLSFLINMPKAATIADPSAPGYVPQTTGAPEYVLATCDVHSRT